MMLDFWASFALCMVAWPVVLIGAGLLVEWIEPSDPYRRDPIPA